MPRDLSFSDLPGSSSSRRYRVPPPPPPASPPPPLGSARRSSGGFRSYADYGSSTRSYEDISRHRTSTHTQELTDSLASLDVSESRSSRRDRENGYGTSSRRSTGRSRSPTTDDLGRSFSSRSIGDNADRSFPDRDNGTGYWDSSRSRWYLPSRVSALREETYVPTYLSSSSSGSSSSRSRNVTSGGSHSSSYNDSDSYGGSSSSFDRDTSSYDRYLSGIGGRSRRSSVYDDSFPNLRRYYDDYI
jgi:hypothetical protein